MDPRTRQSVATATAALLGGHMRIRWVSLIYMACVSVMALAGAGLVFTQRWTQLTEIETTRQLILALQPAVRFVEALALERGVYNQVLVTTDIERQTKDRLVSERHLMTDAVFRETIAQLADLSPSRTGALLASVQQAERLVRAARSHANLFDPPVGDAAALRAISTVQKFSDAGGVLDAAVAQMERAIAAKEARLSVMLEISRLSNEMRELAGQRSTILSRYAGTLRPFGISERVQVSELSGALKVTWKRIQRLAEQMGPTTNLLAAVGRVKQTFFEQGEPVYTSMADAARSGSEPPLDFLTWRAWTVAMLGNTLAARDAPIEQALEEITAMRDAANQSLLWAIIGLSGAMLAVLGAGFFVEWRVVRPVESLTSEIGRVSALDPRDPSWPSDAKVVTLASRHGSRPDEIGELARALARLQQRSADIERLNHHFNAMLAHMPQGLCFFNAAQELVVSNALYAELYGFSPEDIRPGMSLLRLHEMRIEQGVIDTQDGDYAARMLFEIETVGRSEGTVKLSDGRVVSINANKLPSGGWIATHLDVTDSRKAEARIAHMALHDALTGLPNRVSFQQEMDRRLAHDDPAEPIALLCLDLDQFKTVNDTLGHATGDELLKEVATRLKECVGDAAHVSRLGGDEFAVIVAGDCVPESLALLCQSIIGNLSAPYDIGGHALRIGASIGLAVSPADGSNPQSLLIAADMALYRAKFAGRGSFRFYEPEMDAETQRQRLLENDLQKALGEDEFELHFQPILDLHQDRITGFEALLRWNHPTRGNISPAEFIPLAEKTGFITEIGAWVLRNAAVQAMTWPADLKVAVNLSPYQFRTKGLLYDVTSALTQARLPASRLELEITEQLMLENTDAVLGMLHDLRALGIRICMDDFGTGYSSLSYLRKFPFDKVKIDRSFVQGVNEAPESIAIIRAITRLAGALGLATTAEGVETPRERDFVQAEGCDEAQGFLIAAPMPSRDVLSFLQARDGARTAA
jgi:diguanylate cyclase (GGDEF)-like protein